MKNLFSYLLCFALLFLSKAPILAQCTESQALAHLHGNDVRAAFRNGGDMFWDGNTAQYEVTIGQNTINTIFAGALWLAAYDDGGNLLTSCQTYRQQGNDYWAGPLIDTSGLPMDCIGYDRIWKVKGSTVRAFLADFYDNGVLDNPIDTALLAWPGQRNPNSLAYNGFVLPDQELAPYVDYNGDARYNPYDGDYPVIDPMLPNIIADEMLWMVYNDNGNVHGATLGQPLTVEVQLTAYAFQCSNDELLNRTIFTRHKIIHRSALSVRNFRAGLWTDFELGCINDDYIGTIPHLNSVYVYNADNDDDVNCGNTVGYGNNPPVQSLTFLNKNISSSMYHTNSSSSPIGDPTNAIQCYYQLSNQWANATPLTWGGNGYNPTSTDTALYVFPDNPNDAAGWSMHTEGLTGLDQRVVMAIAQDTLLPGEVVELYAAYALHVNADSNHLQNVNLAYNQIPMLQSFYANGYNNGNCSFALPVQKFENATTTNFIKTYPNPAQDILTVESTAEVLESIELLNAVGQSVYLQEKINNQSIQLSIKALPQGIYILKAKSGAQVWSEKIVVGQ